MLADSLSSTQGEATRLREAINALSDQLCESVNGKFDFRVATHANDEAIEKLEMLINFALDSAEHALAETQGAHARLSAMVEDLADAVVAIGEDGVIKSVNAAAEKIFGYERAEMIGENVSILMPSPHREHHDDYLDRYLKTDKATILGSWREVVAQRKDGTLFPVELGVRESGTSKERMFTAVLRDLTKQKEDEAEREQWNKELLEASRRSGMAEVATGVLHNVGNVLNSINVSVALLFDIVNNSRSTGVTRAAHLLEDNKDDLANYLGSDSRGEKLATYLSMSAKALEGERETLLRELTLVVKNTDHVRQIVSIQQSLASTFGVLEAVDVSALVNEAIMINSASMERHKVNIVREFADIPRARLDRQKVLQVVINLISNAKYSVMTNANDDGKITVRTGCDNGNLSITVSDNGEGIKAENLKKIFAHGFTTKKNGHGFGLHASALAAQELGGFLTAYSDGPGRGAKFILELPCEVQEVKA